MQKIHSGRIREAACARPNIDALHNFIDAKVDRVEIGNSGFETLREK